MPTGGGGDATHEMPTLAVLPVPPELLPATLMVWLPTAWPRSRQTFEDVTQPVHVNDVGLPLQYATIVTRSPTTGGSVCLVRFNVQNGAASGGGGACHVMLIVAGALAPLPLLATTEYETVPGDVELALHAD